MLPIPPPGAGERDVSRPEASIVTWNIPVSVSPYGRNRPVMLPSACLRARTRMPALHPPVHLRSAPNWRSCTALFSTSQPPSGAVGVPTSSPLVAFHDACPTLVHSLARSLPLNVQSGMKFQRAASGATAQTTAITIAYTARRLIPASFDSGVARSRRGQCRVQPPSTISTCPTTMSERWLDRYSTAPTRSSGWFQRPAGIISLVAQSL